MLEQHRVPCGPVLSPADTITHPWFVDQGVVRQVTDPEGGTFAAPAFPIRFDGRRPEAPLVPPRLGEHTAEVLAQAGLDEAEIRAVTPPRRPRRTARQAQPPSPAIGLRP